jgi:hypothetical protein
VLLTGSIVGDLAADAALRALPPSPLKFGGVGDTGFGDVQGFSRAPNQVPPFLCVLPISQKIGGVLEDVVGLQTGVLRARTQNDRPDYEGFEAESTFVGPVSVHVTAAPSLAYLPRSHRQTFGNSPYMIRQTPLHGWGDAQRLMDADEVVPRDQQGNRRLQVPQGFAVCVRQSTQTSAVATCRRKLTWSSRSRHGLVWKGEARQAKGLGRNP